MSGTWHVGEEKDRPGVYRRTENGGNIEVAGAEEGVGLAVVSGTWGPLNTPVLTDASEDVASIIGSGKGAKVITEMRTGGVNEIVVVRVGTGGKSAELTLKDDAEADVVTFTTLYPTSRKLSFTVKDSLDDDAARQAILYEGSKALESRTFASGSGEVDAIIEAFADSKYLVGKKKAAGSGTLAAVAQKAFVDGADPEVSTEAYNDGFAASEEESWDGVAVDSEDTAVHTLLQAFIERKFEEGEYPYFCVGEPKSVPFDTRIQHALSFNDEKGHYVLNSYVDSNGAVYEGYLLAARIVGMIISTPSNQTIMHEVISGAVKLNEKLTNAQIKKALRSGCIILTLNRSRQVWIEDDINTLVTLSGDQDEGWKSIRRMKTRFELMKRIDKTLEGLKVDNDTNGRATVISAIQDVLKAMEGENKLLPGGEVALDSKNPPKGNSAWFAIAPDDIETLKRMYLTYRFRFTPDTEEE